MNDRFRFRVWCEEKRTYWVPKIIEETTLFVLARLSEKKNIVEQCTGLKDENGKLIYEGDIVRVFYDHFYGNFTEKEIVGPVVWECGTWVVKEEEIGWFLNHAPEYDENNLESAFVEVIGNIHENKELLEDKDD